MADELDIAAERIDAEMQARIKNRASFDAPSLFECVDCGEDIPKARQDIGGVTRCVDCQNELEQSSKHKRQHKDSLHVWQKMKK